MDRPGGRGGGGRVAVDPAARAEDGMSKEILIAEVRGTRLDGFIAQKMPRYTRSLVKSLIERGFVTVDGVRRDADHRLKEGERVEVSLSSAAPEPTSLPVEVIHEDKDLLVLLKPAGLLMHPLGETWLKVPEAVLAEAQDSMAAWLLKTHPAITRAGTPRCGIVHRLDRQTSGVLLAAKTPKAYESLVNQFKEREIEKLYRAIVRGVPADKRPRVQAPIGRMPGHRKVTVTPFGKSAETAFKVVAAAKDAALVEASPLTGRTHQIRAHLALIGHPVAGDVEFEAAGGPGPIAPRLMLHAYKISFAHPRTRKPVSFSAEPPRDFRDFWSLCRKARKS
jgi:23S rRNA pseudouridine1911/1915/1917 synthase